MESTDAQKRKAEGPPGRDEDLAHAINKASTSALNAADPDALTSDVPRAA